MWLSSEESKPVQPLPETEGLQGAIAYLYKGTESRLTVNEPNKREIVP